MQEPQYLTTREFDSWRVEHDRKVDAILAASELRQERDIKTEGRITTLETHREHAIIGLGIFSSVISAIVGGLVAMVSSR